MGWILIALALPLFIGAALKGGTATLWFRLGVVLVVAALLLFALGAP